MKKLVKYTVYFEYEDTFWDKGRGNRKDRDDGMNYFIEKYNCHTNFLEYLLKRMEEQDDDICNAGVARVIDEKTVPDTILPYRIVNTK